MSANAHKSQVALKGQSCIRSTYMRCIRPREAFRETGIIRSLVKALLLCPVEVCTCITEASVSDADSLFWKHRQQRVQSPIRDDARQRMLSAECVVKRKMNGNRKACTDL